MLGKKNPDKAMSEFVKANYFAVSIKKTKTFMHSNKDSIKTPDMESHLRHWPVTCPFIMIMTPSSGFIPSTLNDWALS